MKLRVISARPAPACRTVLASADWAVRSSATSYGVGSSTGVPLTANCTVRPGPVVRDERRSRAAAREPFSRSGGDRARTKRRASARLSWAASRARRTCGVAGASAGRVRSAARSSNWILDRPWARVSWISRASRSRSASVPAVRSASASSARVDISSSMSSRRRSLSRNSASYPRTVATATAAPSSGPMKAPGVTAWLCSTKQAMAAAAVTATAGSAQRVGSRCSCRKYSGKATHRASGDRTSSASHTAPSAASHSAPARVRGCTAGASAPAA